MTCAQKQMPRRIPSELYRLILEKLDSSPTALHTLLFVSRNLSREAERLLYRRIEVGDWAINGRTSSPMSLPKKKREQRIKSQEAMLLGLARGNRFSAYLLHLNLAWLGNHCYINDYNVAQWTHLMPGLAMNCPNLKSLELPRRHYDAFLPTPNTCFRLQHFKFHYPDPKTADTFRTNLRHFLKSQPEIRRLVVSCRWFNLPKLPPSALPDLHSVTCVPADCLWLIPGRPVEELVLTAALDDGKLLFDGFGLLPHLKRLTISCALSFDKLFWFEKSFVQLKYLFVRMVGRLFLSP